MDATISVPFISRFCSAMEISSPAFFFGMSVFIRTQAAAMALPAPAMSTSLSP